MKRCICLSRWIVLIVVLSGVGCVARSERDVVLYCALDEEFAAPILSAFERSTDEQVDVIGKFDVESNKTVGLVSQILAERDVPRCDVFWNNEILHTVRLQKMGVLSSNAWNVPRDWPAEMIASDGTWCGFAARARVLIVNTDLIPDPAERPDRVTDLADAEWKDRCAMARPLFGTSSTHWAVLREVQGRDATLDQMKIIYQNAVIVSGNKQVARAVATGKVAWGLTDTDDAFIERENGMPVAIIFPDQQPDAPGTLRIPNTIAVMKNAPHPVAAVRLADYVVTPQTEDRLAMGNSSQIPIHREAKFVPAVLPTDAVRWMRCDFEAAANDWESWAAEVANIFGR